MAVTGAIFNSLIYGGVDSAEYGVYITGDAVFNAPKRSVELVSVPGRNGAIEIDQGHFENIEVSYPAGMFGDDKTDFRERLSEFRNAIMSQKGYQRLTDTYHPDEYRMGIYVEGLEVEPTHYNEAGQFTLKFNCKPQRWLTSGEEPINLMEYHSDTYEDNTPYLLRRSAGGETSVPFDTEMDTLIGGTIAWNQKHKSGSLTRTHSSNHITVTFYESGKINVVSDGSNSAIDSVSLMFDSPQFNNAGIGGHKVLFALNCVKGNTSLVKQKLYASTTASWGNTQNIYASLPPGVAPLDLSEIVASLDTGKNYYYWYFNVPGSTTCDIDVYPIVIDLTATFGTEIADYVYGLEQSAEGSGIAWLKSYGFLTKDYYAYNDGSLVSVKTTAHVMRDEDDNIIGNYPLDSDLELRGIPKLSNGNLYYDGDEYRADGTVNRLYRRYTSSTTHTDEYGTLGSGVPYYGIILSNASDKIVDGNTKDMVCNLGYIALGTGETSASGGFRAYNESEFLFYDTRFTSQAVAQQLLADLEIVYKAKTPTTETADPFASPQIVSPYGTEEYVDTRSVPVPVGHRTVYGMDPSVIVNPTLFDAGPLLEVEGYGDIKFNDYQITLREQTLGEVEYIAPGTETSRTQYITPFSGASQIEGGHKYEPIVQDGDAFTFGNILFEITLNYPDAVIWYYNGDPTVYGDPTLPGTFSCSHDQHSLIYRFNTSATELQFDSDGNQRLKTIYRSGNTFTLQDPVSGKTSVPTIELTFQVTLTGFGITPSIDSERWAYVDLYCLSNATVSRNPPYSWETPTIAIRILSQGGVIANSSNLITGTVYIDCDLGDAYMEKDGDLIPINRAIDLGSDLPKLLPGTNEITYDDTYTKLIAEPRWWKI